MTTRTTHSHAGDLGLFLIGMRVNKLWRPDAWIPALRAMRPMIEELYASQESAKASGEDLGFLGHRALIGPGGPTLVQWWRKVDDIYRYAASSAHRHRPAWQAFNEKARKVPGAVGVWHETYAVPAGAHESIYVDMPELGLARVTGSIPVGRRGDRAPERMGQLSQS